MNCIIASTSTVYGSDYLEYLQAPLKELFKDAEQILFIPFARPGGITHEEYTQKAREGLAFLNKEVIGLHQSENYKEAIQNAKAIFTGGGNTFVLVNQLYKNNLLHVLHNRIKDGAAYLGTSAGSNICGKTMHTTNDMPIVYSPSFETLGILDFNINPHYLDPDPTSKHKGETRQTRIKEFHTYNQTPVVGLREGSWLQVSKNNIILKGDLSARIFRASEEPYEMEPEASLKNLR